MNKKPILAFIIIVAAFISTPTTAFAVTESSGIFEVSWDDPLFSKNNILPGDKFEKTIKITNRTNEEQDLNVRFEDQNSTSDNLSSQITLSIFRDSENLLEDKLDKLLDKSETKLLTMGPQKRDLELTLKTEFKKEAGNEYQGKGTKFNIIIGGVTVPAVLAAEAAPTEGPLGSVLGIATGANLIYSVLASLAMFLLGLYLRRRSTAEQIA